MNAVSEMEREKSVSPVLEENIAAMRAMLHADKNKDFVAREFVCLEAPACAMFIEGMAGGDFLDDYILRPLMEHRPASRISPGKRAGYLLKAAVPINQGKLSQSLDELVKRIAKRPNGHLPGRMRRGHPARFPQI